jgi:RND family efflux transporter MFP subunit
VNVRRTESYVSQNGLGENMKRKISLIFPVLIISAFYIASCGGTSKADDPANAPPATVAVAPVQRGSIAHTLDVASEFRPFQEVDLHAKEAGYVKEIYVDVGSHVHAGQLLAVLEIPELKDEITRANAEVSRAQDEITRAQADERRAESAHEVAHVSYTRLAGVVKDRPDLVAQQDVDDAAGKDRETEAQVDTAKATLSSARQQLNVARAGLQKTQTLFAYGDIRAPFDGVVTKRYADKGTMLAAGTSSEKQAIPLVQLSQNGLLRLIIPVPESAVSFIHVGSPAMIRVPELKREISGKVTRFADVVNSETRTMDTEIDVPNAKFELVPGMYANVLLVLEEQPNALTVPVEAIVREGDTATALVVSSAGHIEERQVKLGLESATRFQVLSGLTENELVVLGGRGKLRPGEKVQTKTVEPARVGGR